MTTDVRNPPTAFGIGQGTWPESGPKVLAYDLILDANGLGTFDVTNEIMSDKIDYIQTMYVDNADYNARLDLTFAVTNQRTTCPPQAQGIFTLLIMAGVIQVVAKGPANAKYHILFCNMPLAPNVWKTV